MLIYKEFIVSISFVRLYRPAFRLPSVKCELKWKGNTVSKGIRTGLLHSAYSFKKGFIGLMYNYPLDLDAMRV